MNKNMKVTRNAGAVALTALLALAPVASAQQQPILSGNTRGLAWTLHGPGELKGLSKQSTSLQVSAHPQARVTGAKYDNQTASLAFRIGAPLMAVYTYHDAQLRDQGFARTSQNMSGNTAQAIYSRNNSQVRLTLARQGNNSYRATLDLSGVKMAAGSDAGTTNAAKPTTTPAIAAPATRAANTSAATPSSTATTPIPVTGVGITRFTPEQNTAAGRNALVRARDFAGVPYMLYGPIELNRLSNDPSMVSFSVPQGATLTEMDINANGDLMARIAGTSMDLQQVMDFYGRQFGAQGFKLVNPTDTGAGLDYALTSVYARGANSRVSFSVEKEFDTYRLVWDFQQP